MHRISCLSNIIFRLENDGKIFINRVDVKKNKRGQFQTWQHSTFSMISFLKFQLMTFNFPLYAANIYCLILEIITGNLHFETCAEIWSGYFNLIMKFSKIDVIVCKERFDGIFTCLIPSMFNDDEKFVFQKGTFFIYKQSNMHFPLYFFTKINRGKLLQTCMRLKDFKWTVCDVTARFNGMNFYYYCYYFISSFIQLYRNFHLSRIFHENPGIFRIVY